MEYRRLGRTGLEVSVLGLGAGGASQLGQRYKLTADESGQVVRRALELGVNFFDTAPGYGDTEAVLGQALVDVPRSAYVLSTKFHPFAEDGALRSAGQLRRSLEQSLSRLRTDYVDVYFLHVVAPDRYKAVCEQLLPELRAARAAGLIRHLAITERYQTDHAHVGLQRVIEDGYFDVVMVGFNLLSPAAVQSVLPRARERGVGVVVMCAVRSILVDSAAVRGFVSGWIADGRLPPGLVPEDAPLDWLLDEQTRSVSDAAYKFAAAQPGVGSVLSGTGNIAHLEANVRAILSAPLSAAKTQRVIDVFGPVQHNIQPAHFG
jgi:aryl-alcohol dehydrogenase-like predicted oxidoreductase